MKFILFFSLLLSFSLAGGETEDISSLFPKEKEGWGKKEGLKIYNEKNLFNYINGGAEIYLSYDFRQLAVQKYKKNNEEIIIEICQMNSSSDAYGIFSLDQEGEIVPIGEKGVYGYGSLRFCKGSYFVKIMDLSGKEKNKKLILSWGKKMAEKIKEEGKLPILLSLLPQENLIQNKMRYFHKQMILNQFFPFPQKINFNLDKNTNVVLAEYKFGKENLKLILIEYPDTIKAKEGLENLVKISEEFKEALQEKNFLALILEGKEKKLVKEFILNLEKKLKERK